MLFDGHRAPLSSYHATVRPIAHECDELSRRMSGTCKSRYATYVGDNRLGDSWRQHRIVGYSTTKFGKFNLMLMDHGGNYDIILVLRSHPKSQVQTVQTAPQSSTIYRTGGILE